MKITTQNTRTQIGGFSSVARCALKSLLRRSTAGGSTPHQDVEDSINRALAGYPRNHNYTLRNRTLVPSLRLYRRWKAVSALYPRPLTSLLDVGSCKGFFVFDAARREECERATGIDVNGSFVSTAKGVRTLLQERKADFFNLGHEAFARNLDRHGGPFQTVILLNVYHYLFWGSDEDATAARDHRTILSTLSEVCREVLIFASPLDLKECPESVQAAAKQSLLRAQYTPEKFVEAAEEFFVVERAGSTGGRPLFRLRKRAARPVKECK